jgi:hypothetical protein
MSVRECCRGGDCRLAVRDPCTIPAHLVVERQPAEEACANV